MPEDRTTTPARRWRRIGGRYAPVLAIVALQLLILAAGPNAGSRPATTELGGAAGPAVPLGTPAAPTPGGSTSDGAPPADSPSGSNGAGSGNAAPAGAAPGGTAPAPDRSTPAPGAPGVDAPPAAAQPVDALGRPTDGDRSKCAPDGIRQSAVTDYSPPCIPAFTGDNGGATYRGVTGDTIRIVRYRGLNGDELDAALATQNLATTKEEDREVLEIFEEYFNRTYETYGRRFEFIQYDGTCNVVEADMACFRADAKALVKQHDPFFVMAIQLYWQIGDELAKLGVPSAGTSWGKDRAWFLDRRPLFWELVPEGDTVVEMQADYWCQKLEGGLAERAGDPSIRAQTRRLGILAPEDPNIQGPAKRLRALLSGDRCGSPDNAPKLYIHDNDSSRAQEQFPNIAAQMKADDVTTVTVPNSNFFYNLAMTRAFDQQAYFPEHFLSGTGASDHDAVGRLASTTQWDNAFGISWIEAPQPYEESDWYRAAKTVQPDIDHTSAVHGGTFNHLQLAATLVQAAGPRLTPQTMEQGIFGFPQVGGYSGGEGWAGWRCCIPTLPMHKWGTFAGDYTGHKDAKEVYWDSDRPSDVDGQPGSYVCKDDCRRWQLGQWDASPPVGP